MHELKLMDKILTDFETYFRTLAETGKMAEIAPAQEIRHTVRHVTAWAMP